MQPTSYSTKELVFINTCKPKNLGVRTSTHGKQAEQGRERETETHEAGG